MKIQVEEGNVPGPASRERKAMYYAPGRPGRGCGAIGGTVMVSFRRRNLKPASIWPGLPARALSASRPATRAMYDANVSSRTFGGIAC